MYHARGMKLLESMDEVVSLDNKLNDKTEFNKLLDNLKKVDGRNPREHVYVIMKKLFFNQLQWKLNRRGNGEKISLVKHVNIWSTLLDSFDCSGGSVKDMEISM
ncbi:uncharacterized protein LOC136076839 [Hydra vulgaris]|uniref:Uncharacterized protein LOC136076839 n=1 Tax=Hydra vulgaris TaxID=6087 RepID=A0ABM4BC25_HYDVU